MAEMVRYPLFLDRLLRMLAVVAVLLTQGRVVLLALVEQVETAAVEMVQEVVSLQQPELPIPVAVAEPLTKQTQDLQLVVQVL
jgi:hypothetical protein